MLTRFVSSYPHAEIEQDLYLELTPSGLCVTDCVLTDYIGCGFDNVFGLTWAQIVSAAEKLGVTGSNQHELNDSAKRKLQELTP